MLSLPLRATTLGVRCCWGGYVRQAPHHPSCISDALEKLLSEERQGPPSYTRSESHTSLKVAYHNAPLISWQRDNPKAIVFLEHAREDILTGVTLGKFLKLQIEAVNT